MVLELKGVHGSTEKRGLHVVVQAEPDQILGSSPQDITYKAPSMISERKINFELVRSACDECEYLIVMVTDDMTEDKTAVVPLPWHMLRLSRTALRARVCHDNKFATYSIRSQLNIESPRMASHKYVHN